ncbi:tetratricopeptide repeat protein [Massilia sp. CMS3.1]|uniref:LytR C-terminal domain-containing protein n=1 Tax=Massilia sp. CMS3.1 TaxID=3373083 RepID=UPI003EE66AD5
MQPRRMLKKISVVCAGALLLACADVARQPGAAPGVDADRTYDQGRQHHLAGRYDEAIAAYRTVLAATPRHVRARNALAAAFARRGDFAQAVPIWRTLTDELTPSTGPEGAYLFANLGYAYLLGGDLHNAVAALEKACVLDPLDHRAWNNLGESLRRLGQDERAALMFRQADALREHDFRGDYAAVGGTAVAAIKAAVTSAARPDTGWAATEVRTAADGTLELLRLPAQGALAQSAPVPKPVPPVPPVPRARFDFVLLEIRNGNGVTGMARSLSRKVMGDGLQVTRLSNEKGFQVRRTRIEHHADYRAAAERLAQRLSDRQTGRFDPAQIVQVDNCKPTDVRLILGQDLVRGQLALRPALQNHHTLATAELPAKAP